MACTHRSNKTVMMETPYVERANLNPMDALSAMQGPLHDYGSWIMSGTWYFFLHGPNTFSATPLHPAVHCVQG